MKNRKIRFLAGLLAALSMVVCAMPTTLVKADNTAEATLQSVPDAVRENFQGSKTLYWFGDDTTVQIQLNNMSYVAFINDQYRGNVNTIVSQENISNSEAVYDVPLAGDGIHEIYVAGNDTEGNVFSKIITVGIDKNGPDLTELHGDMGFSYPSMGLNVVRTSPVYDTYYVYTGSFDQGSSSSYNPGAGMVGIRFLSDTLNYEYTIPDTTALNDPNNVIQYDRYSTKAEIKFDYSKIPEGIYKNIKVQTVDCLGKMSGIKAINAFQGNSGCNEDFAFDKTAPAISVENVVNGYVNSDRVIYRLSDNVGLLSANASINNVDYVQENWSNETAPAGEKLVTVALPTSVYADDEEYDIKMTAEDLARYKTESNITVKFDREAPMVTSASITEPYVVNGDEIVFAEAPTLNIEAEDAKSGMGEMCLVDNSTGKETKIENNTVKITKSGSYNVKIEDKLGNTTMRSLKEMLALPSNNISINTTEPVIEYNLPDGVEINGETWYKGNFDIIADLSKTEGLQKADMYINNEKAASVSSDKNSIKANTNAEKDSISKYTVKTEAFNTAGKSAEKTVEFSIDRKKPTVDAISMTKNTDNKMNIKINASDEGSGLCKYTIENGSGVLIENTTGEFSLPDGEYICKVYDQVGNVTSKLLHVQLANNLDNNKWDINPTDKENKPDTNNTEIVKDDANIEATASAKAVKTGDNTPMTTLVYALSIAGCFVIGHAIRTEKRNRNGK